MSTLQVFSNIPNPYNGCLYRELVASGREVEVVYRAVPRSEGRPWDIRLARFERIETRLLPNLRLVRQASRRGPVVVSGGYRTIVEVGRLVALLGRAHSSWYWGERLRPVSAPLELVRRALFATVDEILAIGSWAVPSYREVVASGTRVHVFPYTTTRHRPVRTALASRPTVGYVGSLIRRKGLDRVLEGLAVLSAPDRPDLEVIGSGPEAQPLAAVADRLGLSVAWLGEHDQQAIDERRLRWWAQVVPSRYDGWGVVVPEALTAGVPVLATDTTGAALDLVRQGANGTIIASDDQWPHTLAAYCDAGRAREEGLVARDIGIATSAEAAAPWLLETLGAGHERDFIQDAWSQL